MALYDEKDIGGDSNTPVENQDEQFPKTKEATVVVNSEEIKMDSMLKFISGYHTRVTYFNTLKETDDSSIVSDPNVSGTVLQYVMIENLELKLESALELTDLDTAQGKGIVFIGDYKCRVGDIIVIQFEDNRKAIFDVVDIDTNSYMKKKAYELTFKFKYFKDTNVSDYKNIIDKVVKSLVYNSKGVSENKNILITKEAYEKIIKIDNEITYLENYYNAKFVDNETMMYLVPDSIGSIVDRAMETFIFRTFDHLSTGTAFDIDNENIRDTIFDLLINRNIRMFNHLRNKVEHVRTKENFNKYMATGCLKYLSVDYEATLSRKSIVLPSEDDMVVNDVFSEIKDGDYIFSDYFYNQKTDLRDNKLSIFDKMMYDTILDRTIDLNLIITLLDDYRTLSDKQQFYFIPLMLVILRKVKYNTNSIEGNSSKGYTND